MRMLNLEEQQEKLDFVKEAAECFKNNPGYTTYTSGGIVPGCLFALRFGLGSNCVVVFRIDENFPVENFTEVINKEQ